jgi:hypothetical protein
MLAPQGGDPTPVITGPVSANFARNVKPFHYSYWAQCRNTNIGDGLRWVNYVLTDADTIRRDAVWVGILLGDGAANASMPIAPEKLALTAPTVEGTPINNGEVSYGDFGFCPWFTFCSWRDSTNAPPDNQSGPNVGNGTWNNIYWFDLPGQVNGVIDSAPQIEAWSGFANAPAGVRPPAAYSINPLVQSMTYNVVTYDECMASVARVDQAYYLTKNVIQCNDNVAETRHFCLQWSTDPRYNAVPPGMTVDLSTGYASGIPGGECGPTGLYDADDYARDMADWAGLIEVAPGVPGNFIALFTIGFGAAFVNDPVGAPLLRYIADAGDNGFIDNHVQQDWRDNGVLNGGSFSGDDPCDDPEFTTVPADRIKWCGQYYYATNLADLEAVFEAIAGRLFTRISR